MSILSRKALDGPLSSGECLLSVEGCPRHEACGFRSLIQNSEMAFYGALANETIASIAGKTDFSVASGSSSDDLEEAGSDLLRAGPNSR